MHFRSGENNFRVRINLLNITINFVRIFAFEKNRVISNLTINSISIRKPMNKTFWFFFFKLLIITFNYKLSIYFYNFYYF